MNEPLVFSNTRAGRPNVKAALADGPRNSKGDPCFVSLEQMTKFFIEEDVVYLVNKALYQLDYQSSFHKKRNEEMKLLRAKARAEAPAPQDVPPVAAKVTPKSLEAALRKLRRENDEDLGPQGTFTEELVPPPADALTDEEATALDNAFAKPPKVD